MYLLTLTLSERKAIDWIGYRYFHGDDLRDILWECDWSGGHWDDWHDAWTEDTLITFEVPEHIAWQIKDGIEGENYELACFADELKSKLIAFCEGIV